MKHVIVHENVHGHHCMEGRNVPLTEHTLKTKQTHVYRVMDLMKRVPQTGQSGDPVAVEVAKTAPDACRLDNCQQLGVRVETESTDESNAIKAAEVLPDACRPDNCQELDVKAETESTDEPNAIKAAEALRDACQAYNCLQLDVKFETVLTDEPVACRLDDCHQDGKVETEPANDSVPIQAAEVLPDACRPDNCQQLDVKVETELTDESNAIEAAQVLPDACRLNDCQWLDVKVETEPADSAKSLDVIPKPEPLEDTINDEDGPQIDWKCTDSEDSYRSVINSVKEEVKCGLHVLDDGSLDSVVKQEDMNTPSCSYKSEPESCDPLHETQGHDISFNHHDKDHDFKLDIAQGDVSCSSVLTSEKTYVCNVCKTSCPTPFALSKHLADHHRMNKQGNFTRALNAVMRSHARGVCFRCTLCKSDFHLLKDLKKHVKIHADAGSFLCFVCNETFACSPVLVRHMLNQHCLALECSHVCGVCDQAFVTSDKLNEHIKSHHKAGAKYLKKLESTFDERTYICRQCDMVFTAPSHLRSHWVEHHKHPYSCFICGETFPSFLHFLPVRNKVGQM